MKTDIDKLTDQELVLLMQADTPLGRARKQFSNWSGKIEQAMAQRKSPGIIGMRRMEFKAVQAIAAELGVEL